MIMSATVSIVIFLAGLQRLDHRVVAVVAIDQRPSGAVFLVSCDDDRERTMGVTIMVLEKEQLATR